MVVGTLNRSWAIFVGRGAGDQHVGVLGTRLLQHRRLDAVAHHAAQVQALFEQAQARRVLVNDGDVVLLGDQAFSDAFAHAARAQDDDVHKPKSYVSGWGQPPAHPLKVRAG